MIFIESENKHIKVVDARMGRGKSTAAIRYMDEHKDKQRFLYITPYLSEVERICQWCDFDEPKDDSVEDDASIQQAEQQVPKSAILKEYLREGRNISTTHALFYIMDEEARELVREKHYCLIIDEEIRIIEKVPITYQDLQMLLKHQVQVGEDGQVSWIDESYEGKFSAYKRIADSGSLYCANPTLISILNPDLIRSFEDVFILTYRFGGSLLDAYLTSFGFQVDICGIEKDETGPYFVPHPDCPPPEDFRELIDIEKDSRFNSPGDETYALAKNWYKNRDRDDECIQQLRKNMVNFLRRNRGKNASNERMWTCFKQDIDKLVPTNGRCKNNFVPLNIKASNEYRHCTHLAYMVNRYEDPNVLKFFRKQGFNPDLDGIALSEFLQWIWRSAIRDGKPIHLYIPSYRMRHLLMDWIKENSEGGVEE